jgi:hypothetical protein
MHHDHDGSLILIRLGHHADKLALYLGHALENPSGVSIHSFLSRGALYSADLGVHARQSS